MQNLRNLNSDVPRKFGNNKTGISAKQWAQILGVKLPILDKNAMDTRANRTHSYFRNNGSKGRAGTTKEDPDKQRQEGCCFTCNKQGHLARNCPDKPWKDKGKVKACIAETNDGDSDDITNLDDEAASLYKQARAMKEESKIRFIQMTAKEEPGDGLDFYEA